MVMGPVIPEVLCPSSGWFPLDGHVLDVLTAFGTLILPVFAFLSLLHHRDSLKQWPHSDSNGFRGVSATALNQVELKFPLYVNLVTVGLLLEVKLDMARDNFPSYAKR